MTIRGLGLWCMCVSVLSRVQLSAIPWTVAHQAPPSMGLFQAKILAWVAIPPPGDLPDPGIEPVSPALAGRFFTAEPAGEPTVVHEKERKISFLPRDGSSGLLTGICSHRGGPALGNRRVKTLLQLRVQILGRPQVPGLHLSGLLPWGSGQTSPDCPCLAQPCYSCPRLRFLGFQNLPGSSAG